MATFIEIPEGTEIIPYRYFEDSPELEHVIIPETVNANQSHNKQGNTPVQD